MNRNGITIMRKERRRDRRRTQEIEALLEGREVALVDLSASGFGAALDATDGDIWDFRVGQRLRLELRPGEGEDVVLAVEITRYSPPTGMIAGIFLEISDAAYNTIESLLTGRFKRRG